MTDIQGSSHDPAVTPPRPVVPPPTPVVPPHRPEPAIVETRPLDRVRWAAVLTGLFGTLSVLAVLSVLGAAIGASSLDRFSEMENYGLGAGIWGAISVLIAFAFGGWLAARTAAVGGTCNGLLQGACVWMVTLGLLIYLVAGGVGAAGRTAASVLQETVSNPHLTNLVEDAVRQEQRTNETSATETRSMPHIDGHDVERSASVAAKGAWGTLVAMILGLAAAAGGGLVGARPAVTEYRHPDHVAHVRR